MRRLLVLAGLLLLLILPRVDSAPPAPLRKVSIPDGWLRGNTHAHTLWSDGLGAPDWVVNWYRESGYDFCVLSDHNVMQQGERWVKQPAARLAEQRQLFGNQAQIRGDQLRLATFDELQRRFVTPEFLLIPAEELTDHAESAPVHVNGLNLGETIPPQGGATVRDVINRNVDAVRAQGERLKRPVLAHVNHPNYGYAVTWEDLAHVRNDRFFEVYNGHHLSGNQGDAAHPSLEAMWDKANTLRLTTLHLPPLLAIASDDSHEYAEWGLNHRNPGRGWVVVRGSKLDAGALLGAMGRGDFYASTGVVLRDFGCSGGKYWLKVQPEPGATYTIRFMGRGGLLKKVQGTEASYTFKSPDLFVRATVESSRLHPNPDVAGEPERAWLQPVVVGVKL